MRLLSSSVADRLVVKLNKNIKASGGVMSFGEKDDYPNVIEKTVAGSVTAGSASSIYSKFIMGKGFVDETLNDYVVGVDSRGKEIRMLDLLRACSDSVSLFNGLYLHTPLNIEGKIKDVSLLPFKYCRFSKIDDRGYTESIVVNKNFGTKSFKAEDSVGFSIFNPKPEVVQEQVKKAGGIEKYKGQMYFQFWDNRYLYPLSPFDAVYLDANTEWELSIYKNREIRNGFMLRHLLRIAKFESDENRNEFVSRIMENEGSDGSRVMILEDEYDEVTGAIKESGAFKLEKIDTNVNDKLFENWEQSLSNKIRKAIKALPAILIDYETSALGNTSGEAIRQASLFYNGMTADDRHLMSRVFKEVFAHYHDPAVSEKTNWDIQPLTFI